ncbi:hypothetical protein Hanom_Chr07g00600101 [Helianthus anomalus]
MAGNMFEVGSKCRVEFYCESVHRLWFNLDLFILVPAFFFYFVIIKTQKSIFSVCINRF